MKSGARKRLTKSPDCLLNKNHYCWTAYIQAAYH
jgi:hypothetical protein